MKILKSPRGKSFLLSIWVTAAGRIVDTSTWEPKDILLDVISFLGREIPKLGGDAIYKTMRDEFKDMTLHDAITTYGPAAIELVFIFNPAYQWINLMKNLVEGYGLLTKVESSTRKLVECLLFCQESAAPSDQPTAAPTCIALSPPTTGEVRECCEESGIMIDRITQKCCGADFPVLKTECCPGECTADEWCCSGVCRPGPCCCAKFDDGREYCDGYVYNDPNFHACCGPSETYCSCNACYCVGGGNIGQWSSMLEAWVYCRDQDTISPTPLRYCKFIEDGNRNCILPVQCNAGYVKECYEY